MPNPTNSPTSAVVANDIPGVDIPFSELFGTEPEGSFSSAPAGSNTTTEPVTTEPAQPQAAPTEPEKFSIRTRTGSVYDSVDAVTKGIEEKDTVIEQLREKFKAVTGVDPLAKRPQATTEEFSYIQDPKRFATDLADAAQKGDAAKYVQGLLRLVDEYIAPVKPLFQDFSRTRAQAQVSSEIKDFDTFRTSDAYNRVLTENDVLANAIRGAETNLQYAGQLPALYKLAYAEYTRQRLPELLTAAKQQAAAAAPTTTQVRPTTTSSTLSPGAPVTTQSDQELLRTSDGRKELMRRIEASGQLGVDWDRIRW